MTKFKFVGHIPEHLPLFLNYKPEKEQLGSPSVQFNLVIFGYIFMNSSKLKDLINDFCKLAQEHTQSSQPGDFYKAIFDSKVLGLTGPQPSQAQFDTNSHAGDIIFGLMDKLGFKGALTISVAVPAKGPASVVVNSPNQQLNTAIHNAFNNAVAGAVHKVPPPATDLVLKDIVQAQNA